MGRRKRKRSVGGKEREKLRSEKLAGRREKRKRKSERNRNRQKQREKQSHKVVVGF